MEKLRQKKKKKKTKIEISLYVNGISYLYGKSKKIIFSRIFSSYLSFLITDCTFCEKNRAVYHCPECSDFYCESCDATTHSHKKRKHHIRAKLSLYDIPTASRICHNAIVFFYHLRLLQTLARQKIRRYFDRVTLCHYYYNTCDQSVSWRKPYCLRLEELFPFLTPDEAVARMQGLYRMWLARQRLIKQLLTLYSKIFDRSRARFYYGFLGLSTLVPKQKWYPPILLKKRGIYGMIPILFTPDVAALIIQRKWRAILIHEFIKAALRKSYERQWDPIRGDWKYVHLETAEELLTKPLCLRGDHWDPNEIPNWSLEEVCLFVRRLGFKQYVPDLIKYRVDGRTLLLLDTGDYPSININTRLHIRRIQVEIDKRWPSWKREEINSIHLVRREKLRRQGELETAAIEIQRVFRGHLGRVDVKNVHEVRRVLALKKNYNAHLERGKIWWLEKVNNSPTSAPSSSSLGASPSSLPLTQRRLSTVAIPKTSQIIRAVSSTATELTAPDGSFPIGIAPPLLIPSYPLPPLKNFGKKRTYLSAKGWGGYVTQPDGRDVWKPLESMGPADDVAAGNGPRPEVYRDTHVTTHFTEKLTKTGYDRNRDKMRLKNQQPLLFRVKKNQKKKDESLAIF
jgi:hypothetical protein